MAKIRVKDIADELGLKSKDVIAFLQEQGVESAKSYNSAVEEADADKAKKHFAKASPEEKPAKKTVKKASAAEEKTEKAAKTEKKADAESAEKKTAKKTKTARGKEAVAAENETVQKGAVQAAVSTENLSASEDANNAGNAPVKRKKKIIFVSNPNNSKMGGFKDSGTGRGTRGGARSGFSVSQNAYHPIKPLTMPSQPESYQGDIKKPQPKVPPRKAVVEKPSVKRPAAESRDAVTAENAQATAQAMGAAKEGIKAPVAKTADSVRQDAKRVKRPDAARVAPKAQEEAAQRPAQDAATGKGGRRIKGDKRDAQKGTRERQETDKRRISQEKERRGNKNLINYTEETQMTRQKKVGRFIKPVVVKEEVEEQIKMISVPEKLTIKELADKMRVQPSAIIKKLFMAGQIVTVNSELTYEEAENIAIDYDIICEKEIPVDVIEELLKEEEDAPETLKRRPPVVVVMGHVDHGKTSLLDKIRQTNVIDKEAGGITQKIGAYSVDIKGRSITFLDTPGHEAFTAMRMRGANSTDIAILVVAADDGVMPQTIEAINHAKAAGVEIVVAINKIDKEGANVNRVKQELTEHDLVATDWGGTTEFVEVSAKTGEGIETLLETILLTADILELKANPDREARGLVLEAELDKGRGPVANVLIQKGTLHVGDFISAGACSGKVRAMMDDKGRRVTKALPSQPVEILGLSDVPAAGEILVGHKSDKEAKQYANTYLQQHKKDLIEETKAKMSLDDLYSKIEEGKLKELDIIIKADVQGSAEALKTSLLKLSGDEVVIKVIHSGVGQINESDVTLAATSNAIIIGFDVKPDAQAKSLAEAEGVEIKLYRVIYQAIDDVEAAMKGMLAPVYEERVIGHAEVRQIFKASAIGNIAGSYVLDGQVSRGCRVRIRRDDEMIFEGDLKSLKRFKDDVKEVREGYECGLVFDGFDQMNVGDTVEAYTMVEVPRS
ncbi:MAG: translation initiation factor IF-2 [Lachnospiraceae bacterium]|nr:translation initiation factor IF-2 [Lachnospiraceae bacterium]